MILPFLGTVHAGNTKMICAPLLLLTAILARPVAPVPPQGKPLHVVEETCSAMAYAPDGRIAFAVRHVYSLRRLDIQRDDIWVLSPDGKRKKIVNGEKLVQGPQAFSYAIQSLRWSPDGARLSVEMLTSAIVDQRGTIQEGEVTLMLDENGKEIKVTKGDSVIPNAYSAAWLADNATLVYLMEAVKPKLLFQIGVTRPATGYGGVILPGHTFSAIAWNPKQGTGVAIERSSTLSGPPRLVLVDPGKETVRELAPLEGFTGSIALSPSGNRVAYFRDPEVLEIRDLSHPEQVGRVRVALGTLQWAPDERRLLLKRGVERRASADLVWVTAPQPGSASAAPAIPSADIQPALHGLTFRDFQLSPDGRQIAVIEPGRRNLLVYPAD